MKVKVENYPKVSLGCGTLILIALIVLIFSNSKGPDYETKQKLERLDFQIQQLHQEVKSLESSVHELKVMILEKQKEM